MEERVSTLEKEMRALRELPARVAGIESQILQLRADVREEFSATRTDLLAAIRAGDQETRAELLEVIRSGDQQTRTDLLAAIRAGDQETRTELEAIRSGDQETRDFMRALHEEVLARIATIGEGGKRGRRP